MYKWERDGDGTIGHVLDEFMRRISQASELIENAENMVVNTDSPKINDLRVKLGTIRDVCEDINRLEQQIEEARSVSY